MCKGKDLSWCQSLCIHFPLVEIYQLNQILLFGGIDNSEQPSTGVERVWRAWVICGDEHTLCSNLSTMSGADPAHHASHMTSISNANCGKPAVSPSITRGHALEHNAIRSGWVWELRLARVGIVLLEKAFACVRWSFLINGFVCSAQNHCLHITAQSMVNHVL